MRAALVVTGTEVLEGRVQDENGATLGRWLTGAGVAVERITVVGDDLAAISAAVGEALGSGVDLVVTTGGLGPTHDDRTMEAVAVATGRSLAVHEGALAMVTRALAAAPAGASGAALAEGGRKQATLPEGATVLPPAGSAPGAVVPHGGGVVVVLPGPPWECLAVWRTALRVPAVARVIGADPDAAPVAVMMADVVESEFMDAMGALQPEAHGLVVGVCARPGELEVTVRPPGPGADAFVAGLSVSFPGAIFSTEGARVEEVVGRLLAARGNTLGTAESCTGGLIGALLTSVPGSSAWYAGGVVSYADAVKHSVLGVPGALLREHGAVSAEVAGAMAAGARERLGCDWAISVTGIAGPDGGRPAKPVGLVYVGIAGGGTVTVTEARLHGDRARIRLRASTMAMHALRTALEA